MEPASLPRGRTPTSPGTCPLTAAQPQGQGSSRARQAPGLRLSALPTSQQGTEPAETGQQPPAQPRPQAAAHRGATFHSALPGHSPAPLPPAPPPWPGPGAPSSGAGLRGTQPRGAKAVRGSAEPPHPAAPHPAPEHPRPAPPGPQQTKSPPRLTAPSAPGSPAVHPRPMTPHSKSPVRRRRPAALAPPPAASMPGARRAPGPTGSARRPAHCACAPAAHSMPESDLCLHRTTTPSGQRAHVTRLAEASQ